MLRSNTRSASDPRDLTTWRIGVLLDQPWRFAICSRPTTRRFRCASAGFTTAFVDAPKYRFIAGGIGITPIMTMVEAAALAGADWSLLYGGRSRRSMAFVGELVERHPDRVTVWPHDESGLLDLDSLLGEPQDDTVVYCCGRKRC